MTRSTAAIQDAVTALAKAEAAFQNAHWAAREAHDQRPAESTAKVLDELHKARQSLTALRAQLNALSGAEQAED